MRELIRPGMLWGDEKEKVTCVFRNMTIACRKGYEKEPLFVAANFEKIVFDHCTFEGYEDPHILAATDDVVEVIECSSDVRVQKATQEECLEAHPWGTGILDGKHILAGKRAHKGDKPD